MDLSVDGKKGRLVFQLFNDIVPRTSQNFFELCKGFETADGRLLCYRNTTIHRQIVSKSRIVPHFVIQGGDLDHKASLAAL